MFCAQNLILMGIFFTIPLYLQIVQGFDAFETGLRMLPVSIAMLITATVGARLASRWSPRVIVRGGLGLLLVAVVMLLSTIDPQIDDTAFAVAMGVLGVGFGLMASQLGNVVQSQVGDRDRSEAGGLQYTSQQLGAALGTALIGAVLITGLIGAFTKNVADSPEVSDAASAEVGIRVAGQVSFVSADQVEAAGTEFGLEGAELEALVADYSRRPATGAEDGAAGRRPDRGGVVRRHPQPAERASRRRRGTGAGAPAQCRDGSGIAVRRCHRQADHVAEILARKPCPSRRRRRSTRRLGVVFSEPGLCRRQLGDGEMLAPCPGSMNESARIAGRIQALVADHGDAIERRSRSERESRCRRVIASPSTSRASGPSR